MTATRPSRPVVRSEVESKIVERRRTVLESQRRRRRNRWIALAVVLGVVGAAPAALWSPLADVDQVVVQGAERVDPEEIRAATGVVTGDQVVLVDLSDARDRVRRLPMVAAASIEREWPDTVRVVVVEEVPLVQLRSGETVQVVSSSGRVLPAGLPGADALPVLDVADAGLEVGSQVPDTIAAALVVHDRMSDSLRAELSSGTLGSDGTLSFVLADGGNIRFGSIEDVPAKLVAIEAFLDQVTRECLDVLDVGRPDRPTASRIAGCAVPPPTEMAVGDGARDDVGTAGPPTDATTDSATDSEIPADDEVETPQ